MRLARPASILALFAALALLGSPLFFIIYRLSVFNTVPHDDYAPFLLWVAHQPQGGFPDSPYCYRVLSMIAALPFYYLMPPVPLSNVPANLAPSFLRATAALSALAYLSTVAAGMAAAGLGRGKAGLSRGEAGLAGALLVLLTLYTQITAIDPLAILLITVGLCVVERRWAFAVLVLGSVLVNEKVALVLAIWLSLRCLLHRDDRRAFGWQWGAALAGLVLYAAILRLVPFPGNEYQTTPASLPVTVAENVAAYLSARGLLLNVLPTLVLAGLAAFGTRAMLRPWFRATDLLVIPAMLAVALVVTHLFQAGRLVMHAAPLFVVPAVAALRRVLPERES